MKNKVLLDCVVHGGPRLLGIGGFLYVLAEGVVNPSGNRFWNASGGSCDFSKQEINDAAFFRELITMLQAEYDAHPKRIHFFGHSNGGLCPIGWRRSMPT